MPTGWFDRRTFERPPRCKSGLKGVIYYPWLKKKRWKAYIRRHGQYIGLGYFATKEEAARRFDEEALRLFGPSAYLNRV